MGGIELRVERGRKGSSRSIDDMDVCGIWLGFWMLDFGVMRNCEYLKNQYWPVLDPRMLECGLASEEI